MNPLQALLSHMTLEQKIGQMVCIGFSGTAADPESLRFLEQYPFQNIGLYRRNASTQEGLMAFTRQLQQLLPKQCLGIPPVIAASLEEFLPFFHFPSLVSLTASRQEQDAYALGRCIAQHMISCGVTLLMGPSYDPALLPEPLFQELLHGLADGGLAVMPLLPNAENGLPAWNSLLLAEETNASPVAGLREKGYNGLIALRIPSKSHAHALEQQAVRLAQAGADLFVQAHSRQKQTAVYRGLLTAAESGELPLERIDEAVTRILELKVSAGQLFQDRKTFHPLEHQLAIQKIFQNSVTVCQNPKDLIPAYSKHYRRLLVVIPQSLSCNLGEFLSSGFPETSVVYFPDSPSPQDLQTLYRRVDQSDLTVCCMDPGALAPATFSYMETLALRRPTIYVDPSPAPHRLLMPPKGAALLTYSIYDGAMQAAAEVIMGKTRPCGTCPVFLQGTQQ